MEGRALNHLELITIANKDEQYYRQWLDQDIQELAQQKLGIRRWIQFRSVITVLSRFGYFAMTTLSNSTTPGEEFCEARPSEMDASSNQTTSTFLRNLLMVLMNNELQLPKEVPKLYGKILKDIHYVTFFLFGDFYELAKRATNFTYSTTDPCQYQSTRLTMLYRFIGCISLVQLAFHVHKQLQESQEQEQQQQQQHVMAPDGNIKPIDGETNSIERDPYAICHLCSETRRDATSTLCGHIFCWLCIHNWLKQRNECPICRMPTEPSRLIHLINFR